MRSNTFQCQCGCKVTAHISRLAWVEKREIEGGKSKVVMRWMTTKKCKPEFERELALGLKLELLVRSYADSYWFSRVFAAGRIRQLLYEQHRRCRGEEPARVHARRSAIVFALPRWAGDRLAWRWEKQAVAHNAKQIDSLRLVSEDSTQ